MSLRCHLLSHALALDVRINQGFAFGRCRRCGRDMIRSAKARPATEWRSVPSGFRVVRGPHAVPGGNGSRPMPDRHSTMSGDVLRIGGAVLYWRLIDLLREKRPRREIVRRLSMG
ncbi:hypothetical protein ACVWZA_000872 [Sphingomonas sp. UYAg733]